MKKTTWLIILNILILILLAGASVFGIFFLYDYSAFFRSLFAGGTALLPPGSSDLSAEGVITMSMQFYNQLSLYLFSAIIAVQVGALYLAVIVFSIIRKSCDDIAMKLKKLDNADIFLDVPLYVGLFGTVASFIIMSYNPQASRLIAYSSTLIGIVVSIILRTTVLFPYRQRLLSGKNEK